MQALPGSNRAQMDQMSGPKSTWPITLVVMAAAISGYVIPPALFGERPKFPGHFPAFARAMAAGRVSISAEGNAWRELIPDSRGTRLYLAYPPMPAVLLIPFVSLFGDGITSQIATRVISVLNVVLFDLCLMRLPPLLRRGPFSTAERLGLDLLFAFGTVTCHNAQFGGDWHYAHAVVLCAMLLALYEYAGKGRPILIGLFMAIVILTRPTAVLGCLFFVFPWIRSRNGRQLIQAATFPSAAVVMLGFYNWERFGNPFDFGYSRMFLEGTGKQLMDAYGQFDFRFVPKNAFWFFLAPPWINPQKAPWLGFDPHGLGLFFATPALLYFFVAIWRHFRKEMLQDGISAICAALVPLLAYFNTGSWQFGHRFSMDYLAILMVLVVWGMGPRLSRIGWTAIAVSILIQTLGNLFHPVVFLPASMTPAS